MQEMIIPVGERVVAKNISEDEFKESGDKLFGKFMSVLTAYESKSSPAKKQG